MRPACLAAIAAALMLSGCSSEADAEEPTYEEAIAVVTDDVSFISVEAETPESLHEAGGPCDTLSDDYQVLEDILTEEALSDLCCETWRYEADPDLGEYSPGFIHLIARQPVECSGAP